MMAILKLISVLLIVPTSWLVTSSAPAYKSCPVHDGMATCFTRRFSMGSAPWPTRLRAVEFIGLTGVEIREYLRDATYITRISIKGNQNGLGSWPTDIFKGVPKLNTLIIHTQIDFTLPRELPICLKNLKNMKYIDLGENRMTCTCDLPNLVMNNKWKIRHLEDVRPPRYCNKNGFERDTYTPQDFMRECAWLSAAREVNYDIGESESVLEDWDIAPYEISSYETSWQDYQDNYVQKPEFINEMEDKNDKGAPPKEINLDGGLTIEELMANGGGKKRQRVQYGVLKQTTLKPTTHAPTTTPVPTTTTTKPLRDGKEDKLWVLNYINNVLNRDSLAWTLTNGRDITAELDLNDPVDAGVVRDYLQFNQPVLGP